MCALQALTLDQKLRLTKEMEQRRAEESMQLEKVSMSNKHRYDQLQRYLYTQKAQLDDSKNAYNKEADSAVRVARIERDERLAFEMDQLKREEINEMRLRCGCCCIVSVHGGKFVVVPGNRLGNLRRS